MPQEKNDTDLQHENVGKEIAVNDDAVPLVPTSDHRKNLPSLIQSRE
jgi:hypothetical protein